MEKVTILNISIDNLFQIELLEQLKSGIVFTPNVDHLIKLEKDREFFKIYLIADYKLCDSQLVLYASKFLGTPIKEKISGSDFFPAFYNYHSKNEDIKIFLLGADKGVASKAQDIINSKVGRNIIVGSHSPSFGFDKNEKECMEIVKMINQSEATVLSIGVGAPKQEKWIYNYKDKLPNIKIFLAIGATIDFEADKLKRAPKWMSNSGLEWLHRLLSEPQRLWKRYLIEDMLFFWLVLKQKLNLYEMPIYEEQSYELGENLKEKLSSLVPTLQGSGGKGRDIRDRGELAIHFREHVRHSADGTALRRTGMVSFEEIGVSFEGIEVPQGDKVQKGQKGAKV